MTNLQPKHWAIVLAIIGAVGAQLVGLEHGWHDAMTPGFLGGLLVSIAASITALFVGAPAKKWDGVDRRNGTPPRREP